MPIGSNSGQSLCSGCGSDAIQCGRESLFTNRTREPSATSMFLGLAPEAVMVMTLVLTGGPGSEGPAGESPPQEISVPATMAAQTTETGRVTRTAPFYVVPVRRGKDKSPEGSEVREAAFE